MKNLEMIMLVASLGVNPFMPNAMAEETTGEKVEVKAKDVKRELKKAGHRTEEALCAKGDVACAGEKAKNRVIEAKDATVDKASEVKNKIN